MDIKNTVSVEISGGKSQQNVDKLKRNLTDIEKGADKTKGSTERLRNSLGHFVKSAEKGSKKVSTGFKKMDESSSKFNRSLGVDSGKAIKAFIGYTAAFASVSVALRSVITTTKEFEQSVSQLSAITGAVGEDLEFYAEQSREIGRTTTLSASQAVTAFKLIASAKPDLLGSRDALAAVTKEAVTLAEAASIDLPQAANALGNSLNQFGAGAEEASRFINVLAAGSKFGSSSIQDTAEALKAAGAAANAAGISFESTNAGIQALAAGGLKAAQAGTGLRNVLLILEEEADTNLRPSVVGLATAIQNLSDKNLTLTETTDIFGRESAIAALTLMEQSDTLGTLTENMTATSVAAEQATANFDNLSGDTMRAKSAMEELQLALGTKLTPALRESTQGFTVFANNLAQFVDSDEFEEWTGKTFIALEILATFLATKMVWSLGRASIGFAATTAAQVSTLTATTALTTGFRVLTSATGIGLVVTAVAILTAAFIKLGKSQDDARKGAVDYISGNGGLENIQLAILGVDNQIEDLREVIERESGIFGPFSGRRAGEAHNSILDLKRYLKQLKEEEERLIKVQEREEAQLRSAKVSVGVLKDAYVDLNDVSIELLNTTDLLTVAVAEQEFQMTGVTFGTEGYTQAN